MRWILFSLLFCGALQADIGIRHMRSEKRGPCYRAKPQPCHCSESCIVYEPKVTRVQKEVTIEEPCKQRVMFYKPVYVQQKMCRMVPEYYYQTVCQYVPRYEYRDTMRLRKEVQYVDYCQMEPKEIRVKCTKEPECSPCGSY